MRRRQNELESVNPSHRAVAMWRQIMGNKSGVLRFNYRSGWEACRLHYNTCGPDVFDEYEGSVIVDFEPGFGLHRNTYRFAADVDNVFTEVPPPKLVRYRVFCG